MLKTNSDKFDYTFAPIGIDGSWRCTNDSRIDLVLADFLALFDLTIDDDCQFCRIIRSDGKYKHTYEYRCVNSMQVLITIYHTKII